MSAKTLYQLCGIGLITGGVIAALGNIVQLFTDQPLNALWVPAYLIILLGEMLIALSSPALYVRQARRLGITGLISFILIALAGQILGIGANLLSAFIDPFLASQLPNAGPPSFGLHLLFLSTQVLFALGAVVFGIVAMRKVQSYRWPALLLIICGVASFIAGAANVNLALTLTLALLHLDFALFGFVLVTQARDEAIPSAVPSVGSQIQTS